MANWLKCMTTDGAEVQLNLDQVAFIRPYQKDRGFSGSEIVFAGGGPSPILVNEDKDHLTALAAQSAPHDL
jgi:hypothetical protein